MRALRGTFAVVVVAVGALLLYPRAAHAASCSYTGPDLGTWDLNTHWSCNAIPGAGDDVTLAVNRVQIDTNDESALSLTMGSGTGLVFANSHVLSVSGATTISGSSQHGIDGAGTLSVHTVTWTGGDVCVSNSAALSVGGTLTIPSGAGTFNCNSGGSVVNILTGASLIQTGASRVLTTALDMDGTLLEVQAGTLTLNAAAGTDAGGFTVDSGATLQFNASRTLTSSASVTGAGVLDVSSGSGTTTIPDLASFTPSNLQLESTLTVNGGPALNLPLVNLNGGALNGTRDKTIGTFNNGTLTANAGGTLGGTGTTTINTAFTKTGSGQLNIDSTTVTQNVDPNWNGGDICISSGAWNFPSGRTLTLTSSTGTLNCAGGSPAVNILAGAHLVQSSGTHTISTPLDLDGTLEVQVGTLTLNAAAGTDAGSFTVDAPATLQFNGGRTLTGSGSITGAGVLDVSSGSGTTTIPDLASFTPSNLQLESTLTVNGGPALNLPLVNLNGGALNGTRDKTIGTFNNGTLTANAGGTLGGTGTTTINTAFTKTGSGQLNIDSTTVTQNVDPNWSGGDICITSGVWVLKATLTFSSSTGTLNCIGGSPRVDVVGPNGKLQRSDAGTSTISTPVRATNSGVVTIASGQTFNFNGGLTLLTGGTLGGAGTVGGTITNTSGKVSPGSSPGTLTLTGNYTQGSGGTLAIDVVNSGSVDKLAVGGTATLDGTLAVTDSGASGPGPYQILTAAGGRTGTFSTVNFSGPSYTVTYNQNDVTLSNGPTAVRVASFSAHRVNSGVVVRWRTGQEASLLGFIVYRGRVRLNGTLIAARGSATGAAYRLLDRSARAGVYRLQAVNLDGTRTWIGRVVVRR